MVTPNFNKGDYLEQTIRSVVSQNYPNLQYAVIDGGSTDESVKIIQKYEEYLTYWVSEPDNGMYDALKKGFEALCRMNEGEEVVMGWINSDDLLHPNALWNVAEIFRVYPQINWLTGANTHCDKHGRIVNAWQAKYFSREMFLRGDFMFVQQESTFWRRSLYDKVGGLRTDLKLAGDFDLWLRFLRTDKMFITNGLIGAFRLLNEGQLSQNLEAYLHECREVLAQELITDKERKKLRSIRWRMHIVRMLQKGRIFNHAGAYKVLFKKEITEAKQHHLTFDREAQSYVFIKT